MNINIDFNKIYEIVILDEEKKATDRFILGSIKLITNKKDNLYVLELMKQTKKKGIKNE